MTLRQLVDVARRKENFPRIATARYLQCAYRSLCRVARRKAPAAGNVAEPGPRWLI